MGQKLLFAIKRTQTTHEHQPASVHGHFIQNIQIDFILLAVPFAFGIFLHAHRTRAFGASSKQVRVKPTSELQY